MTFFFYLGNLFAPNQQKVGLEDDFWQKLLATRWVDGMWNETLAQNRVFPFRWVLCTDFIRGNHHETIISRHRLKANLRTLKVNEKWSHTQILMGNQPWNHHVQVIQPMTLLTNFCIHEKVGGHWDFPPVIFRELPPFRSMVMTLSLPNGPQGALHLLAPEVWRMFRNFAEFLSKGSKAYLANG